MRTSEDLRVGTTRIPSTPSKGIQGSLSGNERRKRNKIIFLGERYDSTDLNPLPTTIVKVPTTSTVMWSNMHFGSQRVWSCNDIERFPGTDDNTLTVVTNKFRSPVKLVVDHHSGRFEPGRMVPSSKERPSVTQIFVTGSLLLDLDPRNPKRDHEIKLHQPDYKSTSCFRRHKK